MTAEDNGVGNADVAIAVVDSGVDPGRVGAGRMLPGVNLSDVGAPDDAGDRCGHGTAVAAAALARAPFARVVPVKITDDRGVLRDLRTVDAALEWVLAHHADRGVGVVCLAFADCSQRTDDADADWGRLREVVRRLRQRGIPTVAAAGNWHLEHRRRCDQGMAWPAILREAVSVGALVREAGGLRLAKTTQRLHAGRGAGCATTLFADPGALGGTSGAAAAVAGRLAHLKRSRPRATVDELIAAAVDPRRTAQSDDGLSWPVAAD